MFLASNTKQTTNQLANAGRFSALRERAGMEVEFWRPNTNDILIGVIIDWRSVSTNYGENFQLILRTESGKMVGTWLTAYIKQSLLNQKAEKGDLVSIKFLGKRKSRSGSTYNAYDVIVDRMAA